MNSKFQIDCKPFSLIQMQHLHTRQLLKELNNTRAWGEDDWTDEDWLDLDTYRATIKSVLATREHIPSKKESKEIRKAKIKKGK